MKFLFNNTNKTIDLTDKQVKAILTNLYAGFECLDYTGQECKCNEILGFDCDENDNHCPVKQILSDVITDYRGD